MTKSNPAHLTEAMVLKAWEQLISVELPCAAARKGWPALTPAEFERVLLDQIRGEPGSCATVRGRSAIDMILAIELAERAIEGNACFSAMLARSDAMRSGHPIEQARQEQCSGGKDLWRILGEISKPTCGKARKRREEGEH